MTASGVVLAHDGVVSHLGLLVVGIIAIALNAARWWQIRNVSWWPMFAWTCGILAILIALSPPIERLADESFTGHMVQHLILIVIGAPLVVLGAPVAPARRQRVARLRFGATIRRRMRAWSPVLASTAFVGVLVATHLTGIYDLALRHQSVHDVEHVAYLVSAIALWATVQVGGRRSASRRIGAVFAVIAGSALTSMVILTADRPMIATYADRLGTRDAVTDQHRAAALMWISGMAITLPLLVYTMWRWARTDELVNRRREALMEADQASMTQSRQTI